MLSTPFVATNIVYATVQWLYAVSRIVAILAETFETKSLTVVRLTRGDHAYIAWLSNDFSRPFPKTISWMFSDFLTSLPIN